MGTAKTRIRHGDEVALTRQAVGLFHACMRRQTTIRHLTGDMPKITDAISGIKRQSSEYMPIVRKDDFTKGRGDEVEFQFIQPGGGYPIMGSEYAEGRGSGMSMVTDRLRVNQARFPLDLGDKMSEIRSPHDYRRLGRPELQMKMDDYIDQSIMVHLAGARGFHDNFIEWRVPLESHHNFKKIIVNPLKAPTKNRHLVAGAGAVASPKSNAGELEIATTDVLSMEVVESVAKWVTEVPLPPPKVIINDDKAAKDSPLRVMLVSPAQYHIFSQQRDFMKFQAAAYTRARIAKEHPLFLGDVGLWKGILIKMMPLPIRFYAGNVIKYSPAFDSEAEEEVRVPESFGDSFAVDRAILLGGQALGLGMGGSAQTGIPFFWSEETRDHGDKTELLVGAITGAKKIRFEVDFGTSRRFIDHGVAVLDTAVPINKDIG